MNYKVNLKKNFKKLKKSLFEKRKKLLIKKGKNHNKNFMINMKDLKTNLMMKDRDGKIMCTVNMTDQNKLEKEKKSLLKIS